MAGSWSHTLLNWVNCVLNANVDDLSELIDCKTLTDIIKYLDPTHDKQDNYVAVVKYFLKREYPYFKRIDGVPFIENVEDIILITSLLLHFSCVKIKDLAIRGTMCQNLEQQDQRAIMQFINSLMKHVNITERNLMNSIRASSSELFLDESSTNLSISTPMKSSLALSGSLSISSIASPQPMSTPNTHRSRKVFQLEAELGAERFDRDFLQEELHRQCVRIEELENLQKSYVGEIHRLQDELLIIAENAKDSEADGCCQCRHKDKIYRDQLKSHELEVLRLVSNAVTVEEERDSMKTKLNEAEKNISNWCAQTIEAETTLNLLKSQLEEAKSENSRLKITLADKTRFLEEYRQENRVDTSIECDDDTFSIGRMLNSSFQSNPESLSKVIDIQLKEQINNNKQLTFELDSLKKEFDELTQVLESTRKKLGTSEKDKKHKNQHNEQLKEQIKTIIANYTYEITMYVSQLKSKNNDFKKLTQEIKDLQQSHDDNLEKLNDASREIVEKVDYIDNLIKIHNEVLKDRENHKLNLEQEIVSLRQDKFSLENRQKELQEDLEKSDEMILAKNEENAYLLKDNLNLNDTLNRINTNFTSVIKNLSEEKDQLLDNIKDKDNILSEERERNTLLHEENKKLELIVTNSNAQLIKYEDTVNFKETEITNLEKNTKKINNLLLSSEAELKSLQCEYEMVKDNVFKAEQKNIECITESEFLSSKIEEVNEKLNSHMLGFELLNNNIIACEDLIITNGTNDYVSIWGVFKAKLDTDKQTFANMSSENEVLQSEIVKMKNLVSDQESIIKKLDCENGKAKSDLIALKQKVADNDNANEEFSVQVANLGCEIIKQKVLTDEKQREFDVCQIDCKRLTDEIDNYKKVMASQLDVIERCEAELHQKFEEINNLQLRILSDKNEILEYTKETNDLKASLEECKTQLQDQDLKDALLKKSGETEILLKELSEIKNMQISVVQTKNVEIKELQALVENFNKNIHRYEEEIFSKNSEIERISNDVNNKESQIESLSGEVAGLKQLIEDGKRKLQENIAEMKNVQCYRRDSETKLLSENEQLKEQLRLLDEKLNDVSMRVYTENVRPLVDYDNMLQEKIRLSEELKKQHSDLCKMSDENRALKSAYNLAMIDNEKLQNKQPEVQETSRLVADLRGEYEEKLTKMKQRMKQLYQEQITVYSEKQKEELADMEAQCKKYSDKLKNYESHVNQLSSELWKVGEKLLMEKNEKDWLKMQLKEKNGSRQSLNSITSTISLPQTKRDAVKLNNKDMKPPNSVDMKRRLFKVPENVNTESGGLHVSDEEGELFDNRYINELKSGNYDMKMHSKASNQPDRLSELQYRNSLCLPHLKSSYPAEMQFQALKEDHIKGFVNLDDSITTKYSRPKKEAGQTTYKKPGPPTPSKNGGRNSMQGNELRDPLKEFNVNNKKPTTPSRIKSLFMGNNSKSSRDENSLGTPKSRRLSIFRKPR